MLKLIYYLSNRCSYYRSVTLLSKLNKDKDIDLRLIVTGALCTRDFSKTLKEIKNKYDVIYLPQKDYCGDLCTMASSSCKLGERLVTIWKVNEPHAIILWADRYELLPAALSASYMNIPIIHIQGGEVSGNIDDKVRSAVSSLSDYHFVSHHKAAKKLKDMGLNNVFITGCPSLDFIKDLTIERELKNPKEILCIFHPHTKEIDEIETQVSKVQYFASHFAKDKEAKLTWFASNNDPGYKYITKQLGSTRNILNLKGKDFIKRLSQSIMIIGNSSAGIREASYLGIPSVMIGDRQKNRVISFNVIRSDFNNIYESMGKAWVMWKDLKPSVLFGDGNASHRIVKIIKEELNHE